MRVLLGIFYYTELDISWKFANETHFMTASRGEMEPPTSQTMLQDDATSVVAKIETLLWPIAKFKLRSFETSISVHIRLLDSYRPTAPTIVLLGDSIIERMITT